MLKQPKNPVKGDSMKDHPEKSLRHLKDVNLAHVAILHQRTAAGRAAGLLPAERPKAKQKAPTEKALLKSNFDHGEDESSSS